MENSTVDDKQLPGIVIKLASSTFCNTDSKTLEGKQL